jgi:hypothetical protein
MIFLHPRVMERYAVQDIARYWLGQGYLIHFVLAKSGKSMLILKPIRYSTFLTKGRPFHPPRPLPPNQTRPSG